MNLSDRAVVSHTLETENSVEDDVVIGYEFFLKVCLDDLIVSGGVFADANSSSLFRLVPTI